MNHSIVPNTTPHIVRLELLEDGRPIELPIAAWYVTQDPDDDKQRHYAEPVDVRRTTARRRGKTRSTWCLFDTVAGITVDGWTVDAGLSREQAITKLRRAR